MRVRGKVLDWAIVASALFMLVGLALVSRAGSTGALQSTLISPYHLPLYLGVLVAAFFLFGFVPARRAPRAASGHAQADRQSAAYRLSRVGVVLVAAAFVADFAWQAVAGDTTGPSGLVTPTHLLVFLGIGLVLLGPLHSPTTAAGTGYRGQLPAVLALGLLLALAGGVTQFANPVTVADDLGSSAQPLLDDATDIWQTAPDGTAQTRLTVGSADKFGSPTRATDGRLARTVFSLIPGGDPTSPHGLRVRLSSAAAMATRSPRSRIREAAG